MATNVVEWRHIHSRYLNRTVMQEIGFSGYLVHDIFATLTTWLEEEELALQDLKAYQEFLKDVHGSNHIATLESANPIPKNVIYLQMESVDALSVEATYKGKPLMPFLNALKDRSTYLSNTLDNTSSGRTTDGEFLVLASLPPIPRKPVYRNYDLSKVPTLVRVLNEAGYYTFSIHGHNGNYWNRRTAHSQLGYQDSFFPESLDATEQIGWGISDQSILDQAALKIASSDKPVFAHVILLTNHHPYQHIAKRRGIPTNDIVNNHIVSLGYVDQAIAQFFEKLDEYGKLKDSIIVIFSDHDSSIAQELINRVDLPRKLPHLDSVPLIVHGLDSPPSLVTKACGLQDIPVIVLDELGLPKPFTFSGNAIMSNRPTMNQFGNLVSITEGRTESKSAPIDPSNLTKIALLNPEELEPAP